MLPVFEPLVAAQMTLGAVADVSFAMALGATLLGFGAARRAQTIGVAITVWLVVQLVYLVLEASLMSGTPLRSAGAAVPVVIRQTHFGVMWATGWVAGGVMGLLAWVRVHTDPSGKLDRAITVGLALLGAVIALTHAGMTHAADAGDFTRAEWIHAVHLWMTAAWGGAVICAAWPLRSVFRPWSSETLRHLRHLSRVATWTFVFAIASGLANAARGLGGSLAPLTNSVWGQLLLIKLAAVCIVVLIGAINRLAHLAHRHAIDRPTLTVVMRLLSFEAVLMVVVMAAASVLGHSMPAAVG